MFVLKSETSPVKPENLVNLLNVRKATPGDLSGIYDVACTVGTSEKDPDQGFLIDDYKSNPRYYLNSIRNKIDSLESFYVAEYDQVYGFLIAYSKEQWIKNNPDWMESVQWKPGFDKTLLEDFVVVDKTAISAEYTGFGIGSRIYDYLLDDLRQKNIKHIFAETMICPNPNFASLHFRIKQLYEHVGVNYYSYLEHDYTDLVYHKQV